MKKNIYLTLLGVLLSTFWTYAQLSRMVDITNPGDLSTILSDDKTRVTDLTLTGSINDQDFQTIKQMAALKNLDMSKVNLENGMIPDSAFQSKRLNSLILPEGLTTIGIGAFQNAKISTTLLLPSSLTTIMNYGFAGMKSNVDFSASKNRESNFHK